MLLAGVLLKIGCYGFLRFSLPMCPAATAICLPWLLWLAVIGIIYGACWRCADRHEAAGGLFQRQPHGLCDAGHFRAQSAGPPRGVLQMSTTAFRPGPVRAGRHDLRSLSHAHDCRTRRPGPRLPRLAFFFVLFTLSSIGLPGLNGFAGEFLILAGHVSARLVAIAGRLELAIAGVAVMAVSGVVLGAWYMLWLVQRIFFGPLREPEVHRAAHGRGTNRRAHASHHAPAIRDLNFREMLALLPLAVFVFWIGLFRPRSCGRSGRRSSMWRDRSMPRFQKHYAAPATSPRPFRSLRR